jgi:hypothetical protein
MLPIEGALLLHEPPAVAWLSIISEPAQTTPGPLMGGIDALTVKIPVLKQDALLLKVILVVPAVIPETRPADVMVAIPAVPPDHVPDTDAVSVVLPPAHTLPVVVADGGAVTVTTFTVLQPATFV